ncbi:hypothetical protein V4F87_003300 [Vibrio parahaemolyticus]|nr:hypothetical protein [Vibrio parahaemolyticus]
MICAHNTPAQQNLTLTTRDAQQRNFLETTLKALEVEYHVNDIPNTGFDDHSEFYVSSSSLAVAKFLKKINAIELIQTQWNEEHSFIEHFIEIDDVEVELFFDVCEHYIAYAKTLEYAAEELKDAA